MRPAGTYDVSYDTDQAVVRTRLQWALLLVALGVLFAFPHFGSGPEFMYWVDRLNNIAILIIAVLGLQIVTGYAGQISLGHMGLVCAGAYIAGITANALVGALPPGANWLAFWIALPVAGIGAGLVGVIVGAPSLRIKGFYLALATLAAHQVILWLAQHLPQTKGVYGLFVNFPAIGGFEFNTDLRMFYIIMTVLVLMTFFAKNLMRTRTGRAFIAIRDNDLAAETMGVSVWRYKTLAFFIACFYAGVAGALFIHYRTLATPEDFLLWYSLIFIAMLIVGGVGSITGVFLGVAALDLLDKDVVLRVVSPLLAEHVPWLGATPGAALGWVFYGLVVVAFLIYEPRGLAHRWELFKASYRLYPFPY